MAVTPSATSLKSIVGVGMCCLPRWNEAVGYDGRASFGVNQDRIQQTAVGPNYQHKFSEFRFLLAKTSAFCTDATTLTIALRHEFLDLLVKGLDAMAIISNSLGGFVFLRLLAVHGGKCSDCR